MFPYMGERVENILDKAEYISITLHSRLAKIDAVDEQWLYTPHTPTHKHTFDAGGLLGQQ